MLLHCETCNKDVEEWDIGMHELLAERDVSDELLQEFVEAWEVTLPTERLW